MGIVIESEFTEKMFETYPTQVYVNPFVPGGIEMEHWTKMG